DVVGRGGGSLGLRYFADPSPELISRLISEERIVVVCSAQHEWGGKRLRDPGQLRADQWFSLPMTRHHDSFAHLVARQLASAGLDDVPVMTIDSITAQKRLIEAGIGIALLPESSIHEELRLGTLRTIDVSRLQTTVPIHVLYPKNGHLTGASRALLTLISNAPIRPGFPEQRNRKRKVSREGLAFYRWTPRNTAAPVNGAHVGFGLGADLTRCRPAKPSNRDYGRTRKSRQPRNSEPMSSPTREAAMAAFAKSW